jgi:hypothetical protein
MNFLLTNMPELAYKKQKYQVIQFGKRPAALVIGPKKEEYL